jgi:hypothetical protein
VTAFEKLNKLFRRYSIQQTEMCQNNCFVEAVIYNGMGDFTVFKSEAEDLDQALNDIIKQYADYYGTTVDKVNAFLGE